MLTTRQRDILQLLLDADRPLAAADLAKAMHLTPRQVSYGLQGLKQWLAQRQLAFKLTPSVGVELDCSAAENALLARELQTNTPVQLILKPHQRQQLLALLLLDAGEPAILQQWEQRLDGLVDADDGRLHYDYIAFVGNRGPDIGASYGEVRNRCELRPGGVAVFIGAGGPMGQMHVQRAVELPEGPKTIIATEIAAERMDTLCQSFEPLAAQHGREFHLVNPNEPGVSLYDLVMELT
jgi:hypothetical protein